MPSERKTFWKAPSGRIHIHRHCSGGAGYRNKRVSLSPEQVESAEKCRCVTWGEQAREQERQRLERKSAGSLPTPRQQYFIDRLQSNVDKAEAEVVRITAIVERAAASGLDIEAPRYADYDDEQGYGLPSLASLVGGAEKAVAKRRQERDDYLAKLRTRGVLTGQEGR